MYGSAEVTFDKKVWQLLQISRVRALGLSPSVNWPSRQERDKVGVVVMLRPASPPSRNPGRALSSAHSKGHLGNLRLVVLRGVLQKRQEV
jgi:hypothetical protein